QFFIVTSARNHQSMPATTRIVDTVAITRNVIALD
ncbi:MAG: hypothetical protein ACI9LG_002581, partial [Moritella dasanensis]